VTDDKIEPSGPNLDAARAMIDGAEVVKLEDVKRAGKAEASKESAPRDERPNDPSRGGRRSSRAGKKSELDPDLPGDDDEVPKFLKEWKPPPIDRETGLPEDCPVLPLGISGDASYYLDAERQLRSLEGKSHGRLQILHLFGRRLALVYRYWPRFKDGVMTGWRPERGAEHLMAAAARKGVWNPFERVRGAGAWRGLGGELILHCGDAVWIGPTAAQQRRARDGADKLRPEDRAGYLARELAGEWIAPGANARYVYPASAALARPGLDPEKLGKKFARRSPGHALLETLGTWNWKRGDLDARLALGWICAAMLGGALHWRPMVWLTGGAGTGKSTLQALLKMLFGEEGIVPAADSTAAGIWQQLAYRTVPVALDEMEAEQDNRRNLSVVKLARLAASGGQMMRGGSDHTGVSFTLRSCFFFSSIDIPPLLPQDRTRLAILELGRLRAGAPPPELDPGEIDALGRALRQRLVDHWHRFDDTLEAYRQALIADGHSARGADQFGTLLAAADLALSPNEAPVADAIAEWTDALSPVSLAELSDLGASERAPLNHLLSWRVDGWSGGIKPMVGELVAWAVDEGKSVTLYDEEVDWGVRKENARKLLARHGLKIEEADDAVYVAIANRHAGLASIFKETKWNTPAGETGVWVQSLAKIDGAKPSGKTLWIGAPVKATLIPVHACVERQLDAQDASQQGGEAAGAAAT
jgi:hypothetical protein